MTTEQPGWAEAATSESDLLQRAFTAYDARDLAGLLTLVSEDVDWPDGARRLRGRAALSAYWVAQWSRTRTHDRLQRIDRRADGSVVVRLERVVRSLEGHLLERALFDDVFRLDASRLARLDIEAVSPGR